MYEYGQSCTRKSICYSLSYYSIENLFLIRNKCQKIQAIQDRKEIIGDILFFYINGLTHLKKNVKDLQFVINAIKENIE